MELSLIISQPSASSCQDEPTGRHAASEQKEKKEILIDYDAKFL